MEQARILLSLDLIRILWAKVKFEIVLVLLYLHDKWITIFSDKFVGCGGQAAELREDDLGSDPKFWILDPCSYLGRENVDDDS